jgi:hypothetical protein
LSQTFFPYFFHVHLDILDKVVSSLYANFGTPCIDNGKNSVKTGCLLGDWPDELGKSVWIVDWVSTSPKSYCYKTNIGKVVCKIKEFTLNYETSKKINSDRNKGIWFCL